jgi:hypothetical protein
MPTLRRALFSIVALQVSCASTATFAATCSSQRIEARGEESRYAWVAKTKARASWRYKVRLTPGLGPSYANWAHAEDTEERCLSGPAGTLCIFSGLPCLK